MKAIEFPTGLAKLIGLERKYKDWGKTPDKEKEIMVALAFSTCGVEALQNKNYSEYFVKLSVDHSSLLIDGTEDQIEESNKMLSWFTGLLHENYSDKIRKKKGLYREKAKIYVRVETLRGKNPKLSINKATKEVASQMPYRSEKFVNLRYYDFRRKFDNMPLDEVITKFRLDPELLIDL